MPRGYVNAAASRLSIDGELVRARGHGKVAASRLSIDGELVRATRPREGGGVRGPVLTGSWCALRGYGEGGVFFAPQCSGMSVPISVFFSRGKRRITSSRYA